MNMNRPSPRLAILRAELAAKDDAIRLQRASYKITAAGGISCPVPAPDADSLPLPPSYWDDLEYWLKTLAPAKPATPQPAAQGAALVGAKQAGAELRRSVCITPHAVGGALHHVGKVVKGIPLDRSRPANWRTCDESGWIPHDPKPDSVCPVPDGVWFEARYGDGSPVYDTESTRRDHALLWKSTAGSEPSNDIIAWRPVAAKVAA